MASNSFGNVFRITTWGESHGKAIGCVVDGCPAGLEISEDEINHALARRSPGKSPFVSERKEKDTVEIVSGTFEGKTTGAPISLIIKNHDADSSKYEEMKSLYRPGHAGYTYIQKYGVYDYRGAGRASARETASRVAAGAIAQKILDRYGICIVPFLKSVAGITATVESTQDLEYKVWQSPIYCPDSSAEAQMIDVIRKTKAEGDSIGAVVECLAFNVPAGLGDPVYDKMHARLAYAMMSIPAVRGFEIGEGFHATCMKGSQHNDAYEMFEGKNRPATNHAGGLLGGITTGEPVIFRVAFKPTASIKVEQKTTTLEGEEISFTLPEGSRHDPCVGIRAVPVVKAMCQLVLADVLIDRD